MFFSKFMTLERGCFFFLPVFANGAPRGHMPFLQRRINVAATLSQRCVPTWRYVAGHFCRYQKPSVKPMGRRTDTRDERDQQRLFSLKTFFLKLPRKSNNHKAKKYYSQSSLYRHSIRRQNSL